jgi:transposase
MILRPDSADQVYFTSRAEVVSGEELVLTIDEVVDRLDLGPLYACWQEGGRGFYDPAMMLKVLFFAYCDGERYSRQIAKRIKYDIRYQYFTGSLRPKYRTICRFRTMDSELLASYFVQIVSLCEEFGLIDVSLLAIDGSKIKASASRQRTYRQKDKDKLVSKYRRMLLNDSAADLADIGGDTSENNDEDIGDSRSRAVDRKALKQRVEEALKRLENGESEVNITDGDAKLMKTSDGGIRPAYNGQIAVDNNQLIVAADIGNGVNDGANFISMVKQSQENIHSHIGKYLADGGYYTGRNLKYAVENGLDIYIPPTNGYQESDDKYSRKDFIYDEQLNSYRCPAGKLLRYKYKRQRSGVQVKVYKCSAKDCKSCCYKKQCTKSDCRELNISEVYSDEKALAAKLSSPSGGAIYKRRQILVEPVFGNIKFNLGFNRFCLRGLPKVKIEFLLMCIAHNLKKMAGQWNRIKAAATGSHRRSVWQSFLACKIRLFLNILINIAAVWRTPPLRPDCLQY